MAISDDQIRGWTAQGATQQSTQTYEAVRQALENYRGWPANANKSIYLQGSYGNQTNIRGNSDVDIVVELATTHMPNTSRLTPAEIEVYNRERVPATYFYPQFREHAYSALVAVFGARVKWGNKCINVGGEDQRLNADVVPALEYRNYKRYRPHYDTEDDRGIWFQTTQDPKRDVINYPRLHLANGTSKNVTDRTRGNFKPLVRAFKNARDYLIDQNYLPDHITPSYFLECLIYNIPDPVLAQGITSGFRSGAGFLIDSMNQGRLPQFVCQNGVVQLFGGTPEQWNIDDAVCYIEALRQAL